MPTLSGETKALMGAIAAAVAFLDMKRSARMDHLEARLTHVEADIAEISAEVSVHWTERRSRE